MAIDPPVIGPNGAIEAIDDHAEGTIVEVADAMASVDVVVEVVAAEVVAAADVPAAEAAIAANGEPPQQSSSYTQPYRAGALRSRSRSCAAC